MTLYGEISSKCGRCDHWGSSHLEGGGCQVRHDEIQNLYPGQKPSCSCLGFTLVRDFPAYEVLHLELLEGWDGRVPED